MQTTSQLPLKKNWLWFILIPLTKWLTNRVTRVEVQNASVLRKPGGLVIAANHISWFDSFPLALAIVNESKLPRFLATEEIFNYPIFGRLAKKLGFIPVQKQEISNTFTLHKALNSCAAGDVVVFYPEGRVTNLPGHELLPFKSGAIKTALATKNPLIPVAIWGPQLIAPRPKTFKPFPKQQTRIKFGQPIDLTSYYDKDLSRAELEFLVQKLSTEVNILLNSIRAQ
jgi:1-acyl-sn-glycerol-3-phosphate acyltransferase